MASWSVLFPEWEWIQLLLHQLQSMAHFINDHITLSYHAPPSLELDSIRNREGAKIK